MGRTFGAKSAKQGIIVLLCLLCCQSVHAAHHPLNQYALKRQRLGDSRIVLRLVNRATGQTIWKKQATDLDCVGWSSDHKALALSLFMGGKTPFRLLIWKAGRPARLFDDSPAPGGGSIDGVIDFAWSPDDRRVLFRVWQSGGKMMNNGALFCLDTQAWRSSPVPGGVRRMRWLGPHRVRYTIVTVKSQGSTDRLVEEVRPHFWDVH